MKEQILKWIQALEEEAVKLFDEAEEAREASGYTDLDALEQSVYNDGVLRTLEGLKEYLNEIE